MFSCGYGLNFMNTFQENNTWIENGVWSKCIIMSLSHSVHWRAPTTIKLASVWTFILDKLAHVLWAVAKPKNYLPCMSERASAIHKLFTHLPRNHGDTSIIDVKYVYFRFQTVKLNGMLKPKLRISLLGSSKNFDIWIIAENTWLTVRREWVPIRFRAVFKYFSTMNCRFVVFEPFSKSIFKIMFLWAGIIHWENRKHVSPNQRPFWRLRLLLGCRIVLDVIRWHAIRHKWRTIGRKFSLKRWDEVLGWPFLANLL